MKKLLTLGCSINPKEGWSKCAFNHLKEKVGVLNIDDWTQYGYGGGGNQILPLLGKVHIKICVPDPDISCITTHRSPHRH